MEIEIDFQVFKELTARREREADSYNDVIRRLLGLAHPADAARSAATNALGGAGASAPGAENALAAYAGGQASGTNALAHARGGAWFDNVHFPEGTQFRATYKGKAFFAEIKGGKWVGGDGEVRSSPSAAAGAVSNTNVNGWRFWHAKRPGDLEWARMDELKP